MIITRVTETDAEGNIVVSLAMTRDQFTYLMNVGLGVLLASGAATMQEMSRAQFDETLGQSNNETVIEGVVVPSAAVETSYEEPKNGDIH